MYSLIIKETGEELTQFFKKPTKKEVREWAIKYMGSEDITSYKIIKI